MTSIHNPVVRGVHPDPSVVRVGVDFFLATSTFDLLPGVHIHHSTDLVNWRRIGAAITRPAQYRHDGQPGGVMLFAPTLRYNDGRFYIACTNVDDEQGNFIVSTDDPTGEWSDAVWVDREAFDPSLLFADGTCYYTRRTLAPRADGRLGPVVQAEINPMTGELLGPMRALSPDYGGFSSNDIEGPHLYKIGDWYYLFSAEGGSLKGHMQTCARGQSPWGPFEPCPHNPVLTHRNRVGHPIQTLGHAELFDDQDGNWWAVALGTRHLERGGFVPHHNLGRETFLAPVCWQDGWPVIGNQGQLELEMKSDRPLPGRGVISAVAAPDTVFNSGWVTVGLPPAGLAASSRGAVIALPPGSGLSTTPAVADAGMLLSAQTENRAAFGIRWALPNHPIRAGGAVYSDANHHYALLGSRNQDGTADVRFIRTVDNLITDVNVVVSGDGPLELRIEADPESYRFFLNGELVGQGSARLLSAEVAEAFVACHFALVSQGDPADPAVIFEVLERSTEAR